MVQARAADFVRDLDDGELDCLRDSSCPWLPAVPRGQPARRLQGALAAIRRHHSVLLLQHLFDAVASGTGSRRHAVSPLAWTSGMAVTCSGGVSAVSGGAAMTLTRTRVIRQCSIRSGS